MASVSSAFVSAGARFHNNLFLDRIRVQLRKSQTLATDWRSVFNHPTWSLMSPSVCTMKTCFLKAPWSRGARPGSGCGARESQVCGDPALRAQPPTPAGVCWDTDSSCPVNICTQIPHTCGVNRAIFHFLPVMLPSDRRCSREKEAREQKTPLPRGPRGRTEGDRWVCPGVPAGGSSPARSVL